MKKKVLILTTQFSIGGVQKSLIEALRVLDYSKYDVTLLVRYDKTDIVNLIPNSVNVIVVKEGHYYCKPRALYFRFASQLFNRFNKKKSTEKYHNKYEEYVHQKKIENPYKRYFKKSDFDVVISYTIHICTEMALEIPAKKHYVFFHSSNPDFHREITEKCFPKYDKIIAVGRGVENVLKKSFPQYNDKIILLENYIDAKEILRKSKEYIAYSKHVGITYISTVSRIDKEKGINIAVDAAYLLKNSGYSFRWYVVGDGADRERVEKLISEKRLENYVFLPGFKVNPHPYVALSDVYVQTSLEEAQPLSILEALVLGRPVISTDTLGGRTVLENGEKGLIVPVDAASVANGIIKLIKNPELMQSLKNQYKLEENIKEKREYAKKWDELLSY